MRLLGESAGENVVTCELYVASTKGLPFFAWCDGDDVCAVIGDEGDTAADVLRMLPEVLPEAA